MMGFGASTTADEVLDGLDLSGRTVLVTGCASGIGLETCRALAAHGAHVVGTARTLARAQEALAPLPGRLTAIACDQDDFASVAAAAAAIRALDVPLDAIVANAGIMAPAAPAVRYGVEQQFRVNHLSHMLLVERLLDRLPDGSGRLVAVSSTAAYRAFRGIDWDDLDGHRGYAPFRFYAQSKVANAAWALTMAERLASRGITAVAVHPGVIATTGIGRSLSGLGRALFPLAGRLGKTVPQGAATQVWAAVHPGAAGLSARFLMNCRPAPVPRAAARAAFRTDLWWRSAAILAAHAPA